MRLDSVPPNERLMWHGTGAMAPEVVFRGRNAGLDVRFAGGASSLLPRFVKAVQPRLGPALGRALYLAENAAYSAWSHAHTRDDGLRQVLLVRVLCGQPLNKGQQRDWHMVRGPDVPDSGGLLFNSVRGGPHRHVGTPAWTATNMVAVFDNVQVLPQYVVTVKLNTPP